VAPRRRSLVFVRPRNFTSACEDRASYKVVLSREPRPSFHGKGKDHTEHLPQDWGAWGYCTVLLVTLTFLVSPGPQVVTRDAEGAGEQRDPFCSWSAPNRCKTPMVARCALSVSVVIQSFNRMLAVH
jgi:hypothetical protein